jgi:hypothetical protein
MLSGTSRRENGHTRDPKFLTSQGREGHFGMHGMHERAKLISGKLTVWTAPGSGTEIETQRSGSPRLFRMRPGAHGSLRSSPVAPADPVTSSHHSPIRSIDGRPHDVLSRG